MNDLRKHAAQKIVKNFFEFEDEPITEEAVVKLLSRYVDFSFLEEEIDWWVSATEKGIEAPTESFTPEKNMVAQIFYLGQYEFFKKLLDKNQDWLETVAYE